MDEPLVSIIIPTYNRAHIIGRAINSVRNQTYQKFEIIIVDDHSTDNTEKIIRKIKDPRIHFIRQNKNYGPAVARNVGIKAAKGDFIAFLDSDDEWMPSKLEEEMKILLNARSHIAFVSSNSLRLIGNIKILARVKKNRKFPIGNSLISTLFRRNVFNEIGFFDKNLRCLEDWDMFIRITRKYGFLTINKQLTLIHSSQDNLSKNKFFVMRDLKYFLKKNSKKLSKKLKLLAVIYTITGLNPISEKKAKKERVYSALRHIINNIYPEIIAIIPLFAYFYGGYFFYELTIKIMSKLISLGPNWRLSDKISLSNLIKNYENQIFQ